MGTDASLVVCLGVTVEDLFDYAETDYAIPVYDRLTGLPDGKEIRRGYVWVAKADPEIRLTDYRLVAFFAERDMVDISDHGIDEDYFLDENGNERQNCMLTIYLETIFGVKLQEGEMNRAYNILPVEIPQFYPVLPVLLEKLQDQLFGITPRLMVAVSWSR